MEECCSLRHTESICGEQEIWTRVVKQLNTHSDHDRLFKAVVFAILLCCTHAIEGACHSKPILACKTVRFKIHSHLLHKHSLHSQLYTLILLSMQHKLRVTNLFYQTNNKKKMTSKKTSDKIFALTTVCPIHVVANKNQKHNSLSNTLSKCLKV